MQLAKESNPQICSKYNRAHIPPIDLYLDSRLAAFQNGLASSGVGQLIEKAHSIIQARIRNRRGRKTIGEIIIQEKRKE
jgi:hypothetical protein